MEEGREQKQSAIASRLTTRNTAKLLGMRPSQLRNWVRIGLVEPKRAGAGFLFTFQELVLLRTARGLVESGLSLRKVKSILEGVRRQLPQDRPLTGVQIQVQDRNVIVRDGAEVWEPVSGQSLFNFEIAELEQEVYRLDQIKPQASKTGSEAEAEVFYNRGGELEETDPESAVEAYRKCLQKSPQHRSARLNLGRLLHELGELAEAEACYQTVLSDDPTDATAAYNLGVLFEDRGELNKAVEGYSRALELDSSNQDAHYNLAQIYQKLGNTQSALRHLKLYKQLREQK